MIGAIIGDIVGSRFEFNNIKTKEFDLVGKGTSMTDDSIMTIAIDECLLENKLDSQSVVKSLKKWGRKYPNAGYGGTFYHWIFGDREDPYWSYGNGAAMRVSGVGWFADSEDEVKSMSEAVTGVTHDHPEGLKGAETVAMCVYYARIGKDKEFIRDYIIKQYPEVEYLDYEELRRTYVHGEESCQKSVPQALYCFLISDSFEDCLRTTISIGGDCDTTAAMSCAIAEAYYKEIPENIIDAISEYLTEDVAEVLCGCCRKLVDKTTA